MRGFAIYIYRLSGMFWFSCSYRFCLFMFHLSSGPSLSVSQAFLEVDTQIAAPRRILLSEFAESLGFWLCNLHVFLERALTCCIKINNLFEKIHFLDFIAEVLQEDDTEPKSSKEEWDSPITFTAKSSRKYQAARSWLSVSSVLCGDICCVSCSASFFASLTPYSNPRAVQHSTKLGVEPFVLPSLLWNTHSSEWREPGERCYWRQLQPFRSSKSTGDEEKEVGSPHVRRGSVALAKGSCGSKWYDPEET